MKKKIILIVSVSLFLILAVSALKERQETRKKAKGTEQNQHVDILFTPDMPVVRPSFTFHATARLKNGPSAAHVVSGAQFTLQTSNDASFNPEDSFCLPPFDKGLKSISVSEGKITVMCTIDIKDSPVILGKSGPGSTADLAEISVSISQNTESGGVIPFTLVDTKVISAGLRGGGAIDISTGGQSFDVALATDPTEEILSPTQPAETITAGLTSPPATVTNPAGCPRKREGDANCDGRIDGIDYGIFVLYQCIKTDSDQICSDLRADFNGNGEVDENDRLTVINNLEL